MKLNIATQALIIVVIAMILGSANQLLNPNRVHLALRRPQPKTVADSVLSRTPSLNFTEPQRINKTQLIRLQQETQVILIDARLPEDYQAEHIEGAVNIPFDLLSEYLGKFESLSKDKWLVTYCDGPTCDKAEMLAVELFNYGYPYVAYYHDGLKGWKLDE